MHELSTLVDGEGKISLGKSKVLQCSNCALVESGINEGDPIKLVERGGSGHRSGDRFGGGHVSALKKVKNVPLLRKMQTSGSVGDLNTQSMLSHQDP